jgi:hypothetical protein
MRRQVFEDRLPTIHQRVIERLPLGVIGVGCQFAADLAQEAHAPEDVLAPVGPKCLLEEVALSGRPPSLLLAKHTFSQATRELTSEPWLNCL